MRRTSIAIIALAATLGCGGADEPAAERMDGDPADPAPAEVTKIAIGRESGPVTVDPSDPLSLDPEDVLVGRVETGGESPATLTAVWKNELGEVVGESSRSIEPGEGAGATEFHLSRPAGWSSGEYALEVWVDGRLVEVRPFAVEAEG
ncbi:MAG: hypothetical protein R3326_06335 [Gemmatimonadota bacterium]|nr:hypothetical protein [Gemmatimonadota bacterium]